MSEKSQKTQKKNWFKGLNAEFKKIIDILVNLG